LEKLLSLLEGHNIRLSNPGFHSPHSVPRDIRLRDDLSSESIARDPGHLKACIGRSDLILGLIDASGDAVSLACIRIRNRRPQLEVLWGRIYHVQDARIRLDAITHCLVVLALKKAGYDSLDMTLEPLRTEPYRQLGYASLSLESTGCRMRLRFADGQRWEAPVKCALRQLSGLDDEITRVSKNLSSLLPKSVLDVMAILKCRQKKLYLVGGAVRDAINGGEPGDFDLCTDATPDEILEMLYPHYATKTVGKQFGVVIVKTVEGEFEIATFREDVYDGPGTKKPTVRFSDIRTDAMRRDVTFNALFYDIDGRRIVDLVGGIRDLKHRIVRLVGNPQCRLMEDPLRMLRVVRFAASLGSDSASSSCSGGSAHYVPTGGGRFYFTIDPETESAIVAQSGRLSVLPRERIWEEFKKAHSRIKRFPTYLDLLYKLQLMQYVFPDASIQRRTTGCLYLVCHLADIFGEVDAKLLTGKYKIDSTTAGQVAFLTKLNADSVREKVLQLYRERMACRIDDDAVRDWMEHHAISDEVIRKFLEYRPTTDAMDLEKMGFKGRDIGIELERIEKEKFRSVNHLQTSCCDREEIDESP